MNNFKAKSMGLRRGHYWTDSYSNRNIKRSCRKMARHRLKAELRKECVR